MNFTLSEVWKDVVGYEGIYMVSNKGRIKSLRFGRVRYMAMHKNKYGYVSLGLTKNGKSKSVVVHRIVAEAFIPNPDNKREVNHKDFNKSNNNVDNLEWSSPKENTQHAMLYGKNNKYRVVLDTNTGVYYYNIHEASVYNDIGYQGLKASLYGKFKCKKSNLVLV